MPECEEIYHNGGASTAAYKNPFLYRGYYYDTDVQLYYLNSRYYDWDFTHNDIEVYDNNGKHLGSMDPITGKMYKSAVKGRRLW